MPSRPSFRTGFAALVVVSSFAAAGTAVISACTTTEAAPGRLCTPKNYVFCRCADPKSEGTKQCSDDGKSFAECQCPTTGALGDGAVGFKPEDAGDQTKSALDPKCAGKIAVLAGSSEELEIHGATYGASGWNLQVSVEQDTTKPPSTPSLRGTPRGALVGKTLLAVYPSKLQLMAWTKFEAGQTTISPPQSMGGFADDSPSFVGGATQGTLFYKPAGSNDLATDVYTAGTGWPADDNTNIVVIPNNTIANKTAPAAVGVGSGFAVAFGGGSDQTSVGLQVGGGAGAWDAAAPLPGVQIHAGEAPAIAALSGPEDLMIAYIGPDGKLRSVTRTKATQAWSAPILVDTSATPNGTPVIAALTEGHAMLAWRGSDNAPAASLYTPGSPGAWSNPQGLATVKLRTPPALGTGACQGDLTVTYVDDADGTVWLVFYKDGAWGAPIQVPGLKGMTYAATGEVP